MSATLKLEFLVGTEITDACSEAIRVANLLRLVVIFDFNQVSVMAKPGACPKELSKAVMHEMGSSKTVRIAVAHPSKAGAQFLQQGSLQ